MAAWAELQWAEITAGRSGAGYGRALSLRRPADDESGLCHYLEVTEYGRAAVARADCLGGGGDYIGVGWLDDDVWEQIGSWYWSWSPVYDAATGLGFYAQGTEAVGEAEKQRLVALADRVIQGIVAGGG
jgi:hypothetical protein